MNDIMQKATNHQNNEKREVTENYRLHILQNTTKPTLYHHLSIFHKLTE